MRYAAQAAARAHVAVMQVQCLKGSPELGLKQWSAACLAGGRAAGPNSKSATKLTLHPHTPHSCCRQSSQACLSTKLRACTCTTSTLAPAAAAPTTPPSSPADPTQVWVVPSGGGGQGAKEGQAL